MRNLDYMELFCPIHSISCPKWISILLHYMLLLFLFLTFIYYPHKYTFFILHCFLFVFRSV